MTKQKHLLCAPCARALTGRRSGPRFGTGPCCCGCGSRRSVPVSPRPCASPISTAAYHERRVSEGEGRRLSEACTHLRFLRQVLKVLPRAAVLRFLRPSPLLALDVPARARTRRVSSGEGEGKLSRARPLRPPVAFRWTHLSISPPPSDPLKSESLLSSPLSKSASKSSVWCIILVIAFRSLGALQPST